MNIAIHGEKELLIRLREDLVKAGHEDDEVWNNNVIEIEKAVCMVIDNNKLITLFEHPKFNGVQLHLTASNYTEILNKIIEKK